MCDHTTEAALAVDNASSEQQIYHQTWPSPIYFNLLYCWDRRTLLREK